MKKLFLLMMVLSVSFLIAQTAIAPASGNGSAETPYQIATWQNLYWLSQNSAQWDKHYIQTADIWMPENIVTWDNGKGWTPIGSFATSFTGTYNGGDFLINNIYINRPTQDYLGLFGSISATGGVKVLSNIRLVEVKITCRYIAGGLVGYFGGNGYLKDCSVVDVDITGTNVNITDIVSIGGLVGYLDASWAENSFSSGYIFNDKGRRIGGFVGDFNSAGKTLKNCYSQTAVDGGDHSYEIGGFAGSVTAGTIEYCYSTGYVGTESESPKKGGFCGDVLAFGTSRRNFWNTETSDMTTDVSAANYGRTTVQMKTQLNYQVEAWTFNEDNWKIIEGVEYPFLNGVPVSEEPALVSGRYEINSPGKLYWISEDPNRWGFNYVQTANIDLSVSRYWIDGRGWRRIGYYDYVAGSVPFTGSYDGGNFTISGLYLTRFERTQGLFGMLSDLAVISNLGLINVFIKADVDVGALVGWNNGATINNCYSTGRITGYWSVGGLIGDNRGEVTNCYSRVIVKANENVGGFVGYTASQAISKSYASGDVFGVRDTGGFVGRNDDGGDIVDCYSLGNVTRLRGDNVSFGGFVGNPGGMSRSYSIGWVKDVDGLLIAGNGFSAPHPGVSIADCFWDTETSLTNTSNDGTGKTTHEMKTEVFENWDWITTWERVGYNYPRLRTNPDQTLPVTLSSFTAVYTTANTVNISWTTESESNLIGYHLLRSGINEIGSALRITNNLIVANNQSETSYYDFTDLETEMDNTYYYWLQSSEYDGTIEFFGPVSVKTGIISDENTVIPLITQLNAAYPNPFNPSTTISFDVAERTLVNIGIYNIKGQKVKELVNEEVSAGRYSVVWNGIDENYRQVASGVYFYKMQAEQYVQINKIIMMK